MIQIECNPYYQQKKVVRFCKQNNITVTAYSPLRQANGLLRDPVLNEIAQKKGMTAAQVALKWNVQRGVVVIPKTLSPKRMAENLDIFKYQLTQDEMDKIDKIRPRPKHVDYRKTFRNHPDFYEDENNE